MQPGKSANARRTTWRFKNSTPSSEKRCGSHMPSLEIKVSVFFEQQCGLLSALATATQATASYIADPRVGLPDLHLLPFSMFPGIGEAAESATSDLGGHLKTGHRSTLQNRPPRAWRPRPSVVDRSGSAAGRAADRPLQRVVGRHSQAPLFLSSQTFGSQSSTLFSSGSMIHANLPFSCDSGPWMTSTPPARSCSSSSPRLSTR